MFPSTTVKLKNANIASSLFPFYPPWQLTFQQYNGEVLGSLTFASSKALVCARVSFLGSSDEQSLIVGALNGEVLVRKYRLCVPEPVHSEVRGTLNSTGQYHCTADTCLQVFRRDSDP